MKECEKYEHNFPRYAARNGQSITVVINGDALLEQVTCSKCGKVGQNMTSNKHAEVTDETATYFIN
jgi:hypothetical protein